MQKKYPRNHNVVTFQPSEIVTPCIPNEDRANTDNYRLICIVKDISHQGWHLLQTQFSVLDKLYLTRELNVVPEVNQTALRFEFENAPSKAITLHSVAEKFGTSNKVTVSCTCKKTCSPKSRCNCQKQKLKCTQYCYSSARDCGNMGTFEERTETAVVDRPANNPNSDFPPLLPSNSDKILCYLKNLNIHLSCFQMKDVLSNNRWLLLQMFIFQTKVAVVSLVQKNLMPTPIPIRNEIKSIRKLRLRLIQRL